MQKHSRSVRKNRAMAAEEETSEIEGGWVFSGYEGLRDKAKASQAGTVLGCCWTEAAVVQAGYKAGPVKVFF